MEGPCPTAIDMLWWYGYSVAHWDGDELVVESTNYRDGGWLGYNGSPLTDEARIIERFRCPGWSISTLQVGMMVTVVAYRARNAPNVANTARITFDDGREVITLGTVPRD